MEVDSLKKWAKKEIDVAESKGLFSDQDKELHECYMIAYKAYCDFLDCLNLDGAVPGVVGAIFRQFMDEIPLTPIEDYEEDWIFNSEENGELGFKIYQNRRLPSLFKKVFLNGNDPIYTDTERAICMDVNTNEQYTGGIGFVILNEMIPITLPYQPNGRIKIFTEEFKYHNSNKDFDTFGILVFKFPDGRVREVNRFFKKDMTGGFVEIKKEEYFSRRKSVGLTGKILLERR